MKTTKIVIAVVIVVLIAVLGISSFTVIPTGHTGVLLTFNSSAILFSISFSPIVYSPLIILSLRTSVTSLASDDSPVIAFFHTLSHL